MYLRAMRLLERQADLFAAGRLDEMAESYAFPCPMQMVDERIVLRTPADLTEALATHRRALRAAGAASFTPRIGAIELPRGGRFRVWVRWAHHVRHHAEAVGSEAIYYLSTALREDLLIEMVDVVSLASAARTAAVPALPASA